MFVMGFAVVFCLQMESIAIIPPCLPSQIRLIYPEFPHFANSTYYYWYCIYPGIAGLLAAGFWFVIMAPSAKSASSSAGGAPAKKKSKRKGKKITCRVVGYWWFMRYQFEWDRNSFCRGWLDTGATGSGKTECGINRTMHSVFVNECGEISENWKGSPLELEAERYRGEHETKVKPYLEKINALKKQISSLDVEIQNERESNLLKNLRGKGDDDEEVKSPLQQKRLQLEKQIGLLTDTIRPMQEAFSTKQQQVEAHKYKSFPWGGLCVDEKGAYWQILQGMATYYKRDHHLVLLQTRPDWAPSGWKPPVRFNLLSDDRIPSNTYASAIVTTAKAVTKGGDSNVFFVTQAETNIGWGIELLRSVRDAQRKAGIPMEKCMYPSLKEIHGLLNTRTYFEEAMTRVGAMGKKVPKDDGKGNVTPEILPPTLTSKKLDAALRHFINNYWSQPKDQLGGVQGTINNYLNYFTSDDVAEVFCKDNTMQFDEIDRGRVICIAMPQKLRIERRYVATILKILFYNHVLGRFDGAPGWESRINLLICWQDEAQRFVIEEDGNVDVIRQAAATTIMACQGKPSLYPPLGGKEKATVTILNLRNRLIFQAADLDCATGSSDFLGKVKKKKVSTSRGGKSGVSRSISDEVAYKVEPHTIMNNLGKFCAFICHADGKYVQAFLEPITVDGKTPKWVPLAMAATGRGMEYQVILWRKWFGQKFLGEEDL